ncbi:MAG: peptidylprolyl isomerase [Synechococcus sp. ELA619]
MKSLILGNAVSAISLSEEERNEALKIWSQRLGIKSDEELLAYCKQQLINIDIARYQAELPIRIDRHALEEFSHRAEQRFLKRKAELDQVVYSLIRCRDRGLAQELYLRISEGEATFAELASEHSEGEEKARSGIVGPAPLNQSHPRVTEMLRSGQAKQLFAPIFIDPWWLIVRLEDLKPAVFNESMKLGMCRDLLQEWVNEQLQQQINTLQQASKPTT